MSEICEAIKNYYTLRGLVWPNFDNALKFLHTELAEVYEIDLSRQDNWVRNHPENKPEFNKEALAEELGDAVMMLLVAGMVEGVDPIDALYKKMDRKLKKLITSDTVQYKQETFLSSVESIE